MSFVNENTYTGDCKIVSEKQREKGKVGDSPETSADYAM